ncbi:hypothetical protein HQN89_10890 [Paenibacillus frigoriresistens]|uniref:hypothetical protein n=1 Tax=Paenibacillus alginolyticus TaxID=59839 RepID=UPI00156609BE|nr:hypothetical protein [Paenibacillus frigoriresistens]NRF91525.1 hypothetical protein [Paenibacillus frigoriresistens]
MLKKCSKCGGDKPATTEYFYAHKTRKSGLMADCKICWKKDYSEQKKEYYKKNRSIAIEYLKTYRSEHLEELKEKRKQYVKANKKKIREYYKKYRVIHTDRMRAYSNKSYILNKDQKNAYMRNKRKTDLNCRLLGSLRARVYNAVKKGYKSARTMELLGCTTEHLKTHLESQFDCLMSWENYGTYWHIDHIRPCASFDLLDAEQQKQCFHYSNLQPLEAKKNIIKGAKWEFEMRREHV